MLQQIKTPKKRLSVEGHCVHSNDYSRDDLIPDLYHLRWNIKSSFKNKQDAWFAANTLHLCMVRQETVNLAVPDRQRVLVAGLVVVPLGRAVGRDVDDRVHGDGEL